MDDVSSPPPKTRTKTKTRRIKLIKRKPLAPLAGLHVRRDEFKFQIGNAQYIQFGNMRPELVPPARPTHVFRFKHQIKNLNLNENQKENQKILIF